MNDLVVLQTVKDIFLFLLAKVVPLDSKLIYIRMI